MLKVFFKRNLFCNRNQQRMISFFGDGDRNKPEGEFQDLEETDSLIEEFFDEANFENGSKKEDKKQNQLRILPIQRHPLFPKHLIKFRLAEEHFQFLMRDPSTETVGAFLLKPKSESSEIEDQRKLITGISSLKSIEDVFNIGSYCKTVFNRLERTILLRPLHKIKLLDQVQEKEQNISFPLYKIEHLKDISAQDEIQKQEDKQFLEILVQKLEELKQLLTMYERQNMEAFSMQYDMRHDTDFLDFAAVSLSYMIDSHKIQTVFEEISISKRIKKLCELLDEHIEMRKGMKNLQQNAQAKLQKHSEEVVLKEILKTVQTRLGMDKDEKETLKQKYNKNLEGKQVPEYVTKIYNEEMERLTSTDKNSSEFQVIRAYLDWLTALPWGVQSKENLDLQQAQKILDEDHYGMKDIKERILEFIAVTKLRENVHGKILCFVGPPGVGKTSIGRSIAKALNREFYRISLGGLDDVAELKGHRRTYIGALPGKIVHALKLTQTENPVILIDEIDKVGRRINEGSPENALLEILDPEQNKAFNDNYLDTSVDLSKVLFICTANWAEEISKPLYDRMDIIRIPGYTELEKIHILNKYLEPEAKKRAGMHDKGQLISQETKEVMIREYCREAGVRSLQKYINRIWEILAKKQVSGEEVNVVQPSNLLKFLGHSHFPREKMYEQTPKGVVMGLAYTEMGGSVLYIEVQKIKQSENPSIKITGNIKQVMEESIQIAYTYARKIANLLGTEELEKSMIHLHVPEGAIPKDGPSAGITITTALLSLALKQPAIQNFAMTGELSLTGKVLRIGGLKEKLVAAKREGVSILCLPEGNKDNYEELDDQLKQSFDVHFVQEYPQVFKIAFPQFKEKIEQINLSVN